MSKDFLTSYIRGQWIAAEILMNKINSFHGPLRRKDMYRMLMEFKPILP